MLKRTIKYTDYNGQERVEDFYFNYNVAELSKLEWSKNGGFTGYLKRIIDAQDMEEISKVFDQIVLGSYGIKSLDGRTFRKGENHEYALEFMESAAYPVFFMDLIQTPGALARFCNELIPESLVAKAEEARAKLEADENARLSNAIQ